MDEPSLLRRRGLQVSPGADGSADSAFRAGRLRQGARKAGERQTAPFARYGKGGVSVRQMGKLRLGLWSGEKELQGPRTTPAGGRRAPECAASEVDRAQPPARVAASSQSPAPGLFHRWGN